jgi:hypothetical protein
MRAKRYTEPADREDGAPQDCALEKAFVPGTPMLSR